MDSLGLNSLLHCLNAERVRLVWHLNAWTWLVAIGVFFEIVFLVWDHCEVFREWKSARIRGAIPFPAKPSLSKLICEILSVAAVVVGIVGELRVEAKLGNVDNDIQDANNGIAAILQRESDSQRSRSAGLEKEAAVQRDKADQAELELHRLMAPIYLIPSASGDATPDLSKGLTQRVVLSKDTRVEAPRLPPMPEGGSIRWTLFLDQDASGNHKFSIRFSPLPNEILALRPSHRSTFEYVTDSFGMTSPTGGFPLIDQAIPTAAPKK